jgi:hypothetical protein
LFNTRSGAQTHAACASSPKDSRRLSIAHTNSLTKITQKSGAVRFRINVVSALSRFSPEPFANDLQPADSGKEKQPTRWHIAAP